MKTLVVLDMLCDYQNFKIYFRAKKKKIKAQIPGKNLF